MPSHLDLDSWPRRHHYEFFKSYELPFFNLCADVDVTRLYALSKSEGGPSFFLASFYLALKAVNRVEPLRYRLRDESVVIHEVIHGGATILRHDDTFGFAYFDFVPSYIRFEVEGREILERARRASGMLEDRPERDDVIHSSIIPWVRFTSFAHARKLDSRDSVPKLVFGKQVLQNDRRTMPVSVEVHHALVDGLDVGRFYEHYQALLDDLTALET